ncbi:MAG TPA: hypothetical protein VMD31_17055 [Opitutaceae bacterium]|nr:hypothetical protein [Opitutaceae bacterium]
MKFADAPRLPKLPFILGDIALLLLAAFVADRHPNPLTPLPLLIITACVVAGVVATMIPFLVNYARDQEEAATSLRQELGEQFKRLMAASEHLQHATAQLKTIEEIATKNLQAAEKLPYRLQEKIAEFNQQLAETENEEQEALNQELAALRASESERLAGIADKIARAAAEWTKLEAELRKQLAEAAQLEPKLTAVLATLDARIAALAAAAPAPVFTAPAPIAIPTIPPPAAEPPPVAAAAEPVAAPAAAAPAPDGAPVAESAPAPKPPRKPRPPRKPKVEESAPEAAPVVAPVSAPTELIAEPVTDEPPPPENFSQVPAEEAKAAPAASADGRTRLTVVSYIGIGNKLYLRGEGPGLSWDKGVPLQFVSIGRWRWETGDATAPVSCKVLKNDKLEAPGGAITLAPGTEQEITTSF